MMKNKLKRIVSLLSILSLGFCGGYGLIAYAHTIPGWDEPFNPALYYNLTEISWEDSPSPFALRDLARNGGNVYDYTRHIKSMIFGDKFEKTAETDKSKTENDEINTTSFSKEVFAETAEALNVIGLGTNKVAKNVVIDETNPYLRQEIDDWDSYDPNSYNREGKYKWLDGTYRSFAEGAKDELDEMSNVMVSAETILNHTNIAKGELQLYQAQNELKTLLAYELARQNALDANLAQMQAVYQANEYDENVESAYIDSITKMDIADPYDEVNYKMLKEEYGYEKPKAVGMPDFK